MPAAMKVICAWCRREGRPAYLGEREPLDDPAETHGICRRHQRQALAALPSRSFPGVELLLVVSARETALFKYLERRCAGVRGVKVLMERRTRERRQERRRVACERRRAARRVSRGETHALGATVVRFGKRPEPPDARPSTP